jgi:hypothetical protein
MLVDATPPPFYSETQTESFMKLSHMMDTGLSFTPNMASIFSFGTTEGMEDQEDQLAQKTCFWTQIS